MQKSAMHHKWLEDFAVLARERNFSKAASLRHATQQQFSRRIRALDLWAGAELVNRTGTPITLTAAGDTLLSASKQAVHALKDARERITHWQGGGQWTTLFTGRTLSRMAVPLWLSKVQAELGGAGVEVPLRLMTGSIHDGVISLEQGGADLLLSFAHPRLALALALDKQQFDCMTLGHDELVAVSAPLPHGKPRHALPGTAARPVKALGFAPQLSLAQILQDSLARSKKPLHLNVLTESDFAESLHE